MSLRAVAKYVISFKKINLIKEIIPKYILAIFMPQSKVCQSLFNI